MHVAENYGLGYHSALARVPTYTASSLMPLVKEALPVSYYRPGCLGGVVLSCRFL